MGGALFGLVVVAAAVGGWIALLRGRYVAGGACGLALLGVAWLMATALANLMSFD